MAGDQNESLSLLHAGKVRIYRLNAENGILNLNMTKKDLASYLSMQPETLTRNLKELENAESI